MRAWLVVLATSTLLDPLAAAAQSPPRPSTNFTVSPPPLGYPAYASALVDRIDERQEVSPLSVSLAAGVLLVSGDDVSLKGGGVFVTPRVTAGPGAVTLALGVTRLGGEAGGLDINAWGVEGQLGLELNLLELPALRAVLFAGYDLGWSYTWFTIENLPYATTTVNTGVNVHTLLHGPLFGLQVHLLAIESFVVTPFALVKSMGGESDPEPLVNLWSALDEPYEVERYTSVTFGFDVLYEPLDLTLSGIADLAGSSGDSDGTRTLMLTLGYAFY